MLRQYDESLDNRFPVFRLNGTVSLERLEEFTCHSSRTIGSFKMIQLRCFETSETDYPVTRRHIGHEINPHIRRCEKRKIAVKIILHRIYRVIHKSLRDFRHLRYSSQDGHAEVAHVNRGKDTPNFCPTFLPHTLHVCGRNLITGLTSAASPRVDISSTCKVGQKLGVSLPLLTLSPSA